jgi:AcrR family transcriptional regulator
LKEDFTQCKVVLIQVYEELYTMSSGDPETRERILYATWQLMEKRRGQGVRLEDIAQAAEVSRQAIYLHFGSRAGLLIATTHYLDERLNLTERTRYRTEEQNGIKSLEAFVEFWANYIPDIYGLAKALLTVRDSDKAAAAAWEDRMTAVRRGCNRVIQLLANDGTLSPDWPIDIATDFMWASLAITNWENLTMECGWSNEMYIERTKTILKSTLVKAV